MDPASSIDFARTAILVLLEIIAPSMITALVVGLGIGLLQALTQEGLGVIGRCSDVCFH